ncbi:MAG: hypothetical protein WBD40_03075 [Tepidisphaeraceae bacterium]
MNRCCLIFSLAWMTCFASRALAQDEDYERAPIHYSTATPNDPVAQLIKRIERGEAALEFTPGLGYLPAVLRELDIPASSQGLVFSRTSLQRQKISATKPRAIYFNDDAYVGYVQDGGMIELAAADPTLGAVFYTIDNDPPDNDPPDANARRRGRFSDPVHAQAPTTHPASPRPSPPIVRQIDNCLNCHGNGMTTEIPGLMLRSVFPDARGNAILAGGIKASDHASPLANRWGGWYLTGSTGDLRTMANTYYKPRKGLEDPEPIPGRGVNVTDLSDFLDTSKYLTPHSDPVALMVMEHQVEVHNRLTYAAQATLRALHDERIINDALGETRPPGTHADSTMSRVRNAAEPLVEYLLFSGEAKLTSPIVGTSNFAKDFPARGPRDAKGRSLRDLDFKTRLMRYPLSYLIYSPTFDGLPDLARARVYQRLWDVLSGADTSKPFAHLRAEDRQAIIEIVRQTKRDLPDYWR